ncbi:conserved hypothetical protein [Ignisphaera aggregans DSM 17230]|uniref:AAA+ ATPase domain-containing protein n=1 Tax=Ignisphaera aggregans (strain DSM 17230 / JCM 13409 / AQ1.S1) TaxID=583356 RepID=E0STC9_IGNAA|nr:conserved hypothetical protein [Ignisphaera aggregans DSM 17230]
MIKSARLKVKNFGYVGEGKIELAPITVLIGPNNTGKSYTAMLLYALIKSSQRIIKTVKFPLIGSVLVKDLEKSSLGSFVYEYLEKLRKIYQNSINKSKNRQKIEELNKTLKEFTERSIELYRIELNKELNSKNYKELVITETERVFSSRLTDLVRRESNEMNAELELEGEFFKLSYDLKVSIPKPGVEQDAYVDLNITLTPKTGIILKNLEKDIVIRSSRFYRYIYFYLRRSAKEPILRFLFDIIYEIYALLYEALEKDFIDFDIRYFPASRAGILHSYRTVAHALIKSVPEMPIRGAEIPRVPGILADFLAELISLEPRTGAGDELKEVSGLLEEVLEGSIELVRRGDISLPEPVYRSKEFEFSLPNVSSMIAELSPLDLYLKYGLIRKNDILIIEEPEAHLHPDKQARLVEVLALLAKRLGVKVIITTHSDVILTKLSNLVMAGYTDASGFRVVLKPEDVKVYSFSRGEGFSIIEEVKVSEMGIPDDVFRKIVEELYEEHMNLYYRIQMIKAEGEALGGKDSEDQKCEDNSST